MIKLADVRMTIVGSIAMLLSTTALANGGWAVIVYNPATASWGSLHGASSRADAEQGALNYCGQNCASVDVNTLEQENSGLIEAVAYDGWVALATGTGGYGTSDRIDNQADAEQSALANCNSVATNCTILRSVSSFVSSPDVDGVRPAKK